MLEYAIHLRIRCEYTSCIGRVFGKKNYSFWYYNHFFHFFKYLSISWHAFDISVNVGMFMKFCKRTAFNAYSLLSFSISCSVFSFDFFLSPDGYAFFFQNFISSSLSALLGNTVKWHLVFSKFQVVQLLIFLIKQHSNFFHKAWKI